MGHSMKGKKHIKSAILSLKLFTIWNTFLLQYACKVTYDQNVIYKNIT